LRALKGTQAQFASTFEYVGVWEKENAKVSGPLLAVHIELLLLSIVKNEIWIAFMVLASSVRVSHLNKRPSIVLLPRA